MLRFFDLPTTQWRSLNGCLHLYALPARPAPIRDDFAQMARTLGNIPGLGLQPEEYMHITVQRFDGFVGDLEKGSWQEFIHALPKTVHDHAAFEVEFAAPNAMSHAVEAVGSVSPEWTALVTGLRALAAECGLIDALTPPPYAPHFTLAYCIAPTADHFIEDALAPEARKTTVEISQLALVAVDQDPIAGLFSYRPIWLGHLAGKLSPQLPERDEVPRKEPVR